MNAARRAPAPPRDRHGRFVDWSRRTRSQPLRWHLPRTEADVVAVVRQAHDAGRRLRVVGAGHSWSGINLPEQDAVSLDGMAASIRVDVDARTVTVAAGTRLRTLSRVLAAQQLSLPIVGSIQAQSVAGAIGTGTHGSSLRHGNLSSLVSSARVVTAAGDVLEVGSGDPRLDAVRVHLGALGIVTEVTLPVRPARHLRQSVEHVPVGDAAAALAETARSAEYVKVWWLPHAPVAQVVRYDETDAPITRRPTSATARWIDERVLHRSAFPAFVALLNRRPALAPALAAWLSTRYLGKPVQVGADMLLLNTPMPMRHRETEAAVPLAAAPAALAELLATFRHGRPAVLFPLEIRFVREDGGWLSPAYGADTCQIGAYSPEGPDCASYFSTFWSVMREHGARPHWGKEMSQGADELRPLYPRYDDFLMVRRALDPGLLFTGAFHRRVLGS